VAAADVKTAARFTMVLLTAAVLQRSVLSELRIDGASVDVLLALAVGAGLAAGPDRGALTGFSAGLVADLLAQTTPLGLNALTWCLVGWVVGRTRDSALRSSRVLPVLTGVTAGAASVGLWLAVAYVMGTITELPPALLTTLAVVALGTGALALPARRAMRWVFPDDARTSWAVTVR